MRATLILNRSTAVSIAALAMLFYALVFAAGFLAALSERRLPAGRSGGFQPARRPSVAPTTMAVIDWRAPLRHWFQPRPMPVQPPPPVTVTALIHDAAVRHAVAPSLVAAMIRVESDFNPREVSPKGACGLMQVMPETAARFGVRRSEIFDPARNIAAGTAYISWLLDRYRGDLDLALAAYNAGEGAVDAWRGIPPYRETQQYVRRVRAALRRE
jgi:soluble lytic murein transglycosylase-like protein